MRRKTMMSAFSIKEPLHDAIWATSRMNIVSHIASTAVKPKSEMQMVFVPFGTEKGTLLTTDCGVQSTYSLSLSFSLSLSLSLSQWREFKG